MSRGISGADKTTDKELIELILPQTLPCGHGTQTQTASPLDIGLMRIPDGTTVRSQTLALCKTPLNLLIVLSALEIRALSSDPSTLPPMRSVCLCTELGWGSRLVRRTSDVLIQAFKQRLCLVH